MKHFSLIVHCSIICSHKLQKNLGGLEFNALNQVFVYADFNLLGNNINTIKNNSELHTLVKEQVKINIDEIRNMNMTTNHNQQKYHCLNFI
jgi:hypothetical protein